MDTSGRRIEPAAAGGDCSANSGIYKIVTEGVISESDTFMKAFLR